ncbi:hypothetical protein DWU98_07665 [Dyella monticola]|uniref:Dermonecrotic toxin N-terminal domain-containing protein n=2 Tax=Dyella monticola TaxID=1927958 RepID=A0A370X3Z8_9GAMM|nr:hypothetical protein DWU98_07665 [Dyella monticola]
MDPDVREDLESRNEGLIFKSQQLAETIPSYHGESASYMKQFIKDHFGIEIDPDKTYLNEYEPINEKVPSRAGPAYPPTDKEAGVGRLIHSTPLSQIAYGNLYTLISKESKRFHISTSNDPKQSATDEKDVIDSHAFYDSLSDLDFKTYYKNKIDQFYKAHGDEARNVSKLRAMLDIDMQHALGELDDKSYALAKRAFNPDPNDSDPPKVYPFAFNGYQSNDGLVIVGKDRVLTYFRGEDRPVTTFADQDDFTHHWGTKLCGNKDDGLTDFAVKHFSENDVNGRAGGPGVLGTLRADGFFEKANVTWQWIKNGFTYPVSFDQKEIHNDPFGSLAAINQRHDKEDADFDITSNSDVTKKKAIRVMDYMPLPFASGLAGIFLGKTKSQQDDGAFSLGIDLLSAGLAKIHPRLSVGVDYGYPLIQALQKEHSTLDPSKPGNPMDVDDPNNAGNTQLHWARYGVNNWNKSL